MEKIGFIGLGHMGGPMAHNLLKAGHQVMVHDIDPEKMVLLVEQGAVLAKSIKDLVKECDVIFTMLQTGEQVKKVCLQKNGLFNLAKVGTLYIDSSSIEMTTTQELHQIALEKGIAMVDAPVSGGTMGATQATLTIMVGGEAQNFQRAKPLLEKLGKKIIHAGAPGSGQAAKICNNLILAISMIGVCEGFNLAEKLGLDAKKFFEISSNASGQCWSMTSYCPVPGVLEHVPASHQYVAGFQSLMMLKDLHLAKHAGETVDALMPLGEVATELYSLFVERGHAEEDFSGIFKMIAQ